MSKPYCNVRRLNLGIMEDVLIKLEIIKLQLWLKDDKKYVTNSLTYTQHIT